MPSKRIYPITRCANPVCGIRRYFYPHDRRQKFCTKQCRIDHSNDKRSLKEKSLKAYLKKVDEQDQKLDVLYTHLGYKSVPVEDFMLHLFEIDLSLAMPEKHLTYKKEVLWFRAYGLIKLNRKGTLYQIVCRNDSN